MCIDSITKLMIPTAVEIIDFKVPLFLMLELIDNILQVSTIDAMWSEKLDKLICTFILFNFYLELLRGDHARVWHVPLLC